MVNSTAAGGGVAEMLPKQISMLRELGVDTRWLVVGGDSPEFFSVTKRLHNLIHASGEPGVSAEEAQLYDQVSRSFADAAEARIRPGDVLVVHDPQPVGMGALLRQRLPISTVWRCHIGLDQATEATRSAWRFLKPNQLSFDHSVFSSTAYIPSFLAGKASVIRPALDPLGHKNRELHPVKLAGVLNNAGLLETHEPAITPAFDPPVVRLTPDGDFRALDGAAQIGVMFRPTVTQISRWDRLKGWQPLLEGFVRLKQRPSDANATPRMNKRLELVRLILAGPDPESVQDDPEAREVLDELIAQYRSLDPALQRDIAILSLPMRSSKANALIVNALQRCSSVVAQNSIREGFGLVVAEAMWKRTPVMGSTAHGIRKQIRDGIDGVLVSDPSDPKCVEQSLWRVLEDANRRAAWVRSAQRRVYDEFLIFKQLRRWLEVLTATVSGVPPTDHSE
jgi:trehalose synthase